MAQYSKYNFEMFEAPTPNRQSTAPKIKPNNTRPDLKLVKSPKLTRAQQKAQVALANKKVFKALMFALAGIFACALVICSMITLDEVNRDIDKLDKSMRIAKSETVRLNMELDSIVSIDKVEDYAANTLGMVKVQDYQVVYVDLSSSDRVLMAGGKNTADVSVINSNNN